MMMKFTHLTHHWNAGEAYSVISFLDELRDVLWTTYGEEITEMLQNASQSCESGDEAGIPEFDDDIDF